MRSLPLILRDIKVEHTLFAMPFAVMSAFIAAGGLPESRPFLLLLLALLFARSAAMSFNRVADAGFDSLNPRTKNRPLPSGKTKTSRYVLFVIIMSACFIVTTWFINQLAFILSPVALAIIFFYSLTKRFTSYSHFLLGFALSLAPIGAWVAIKGEIGIESFILGLAVVFWLVGLDIIYSCQDFEHDRSFGLHSIPAKFGIRRALLYSSFSHFVMLVFLLILYSMSPHLGLVFLTGVGLTAALLLYEHSIVKSEDLQKVNVAFFNVNGFISVGLMIFVIADTLI